MTMPELTGFSSRSIPAILFCLLAFNSQAAMYKWVDEDGVTHYTQQPPPGDVESETIKPPPGVNSGSGEETSKQRQKYMDTLSGDDEEEQSGKKEQDEEPVQASEEACNKARKRLQSFQRPRVNYMDENGNRVRATEEQRQRELEKTREYLRKHCK